MRPHFVKSSITTLLLFFCLTGRTQSPFTLNPDQQEYRLDKFVSVFVDNTESVSFEQITADEFQQRFTPHQKNLTFGYLKAAIWLKLELQTSDPSKEWMLHIPAPFLELVRFYQRTDSANWQESQSGYYLPYSERESKHTGHVLPLHFGKQHSSTVYIRISGVSPKTFPLYATQSEAFYEQIRLEDIGYGIFFGILFVMFFYNLIIYFSLRQTNYLLYICTIVCTFFVFASASGYGGKFLWPETPVLNYYAGRLSLPVMTVALSLFALRFLDVKEWSKPMYYILASLLPLSVVALLLIMTGILPSAGNNLVSFSTLIYLATGIVCRIKGNKNANYFIAAWSIYIIGGLVLTLRNSGVFDYNAVTTHFVELGAALETIIIAFALGDRYRRLKQEKEAAQLHALNLQLGENERLERKVRERTEALSQANAELQLTLETNRLQTHIIENKNAELDSFFYRISHDLKGPIATLRALSTLASMEVSDPAAKLYLEKQKYQVERLNNIISGLIKLTRLNGPIDKQKIEFVTLVNDCIDSLRSHEHFSRIEFITNIQRDIEFHSEWTLINAIIQNLIENGVKYSREISAFVKIDIGQRTDGSVEIRVSDNGHGIADDHQKRIFEMFYRASESVQGSGLGLYILKRSVDKLGGTINIDSRIGEGTAFTITLPAIPFAELQT